MTTPTLTLACSASDRTTPLLRQACGAAGVDIHVLTLPVEEIFYRMLRYEEFDAAEMSLSSYVASLDHEPARFIAIPVFPSRSFRHGCVFVNRRAGIENPADLVGKRVGTPEYEMTAGVWIRGIFTDDYGLPVGGPDYLTGGLEEPGRLAKTELTLPPGVTVRAIPEGATLSEMLADGSIDALYTARMPSCFVSGHPDVDRLFLDYADVEADYFRRTKIFPIMHTVVLRQAVYEERPWLARELMKAMEQARAASMNNLYEAVALPVMLPWLPHHVEQTRRIMGDRFWDYGVQPNRDTIATFLRYAYQQGITQQHRQPDDLFAPETHSVFKV